MSDTTANYGLYITDDSSERFLEWRTKMNGTENSNMVKIDAALGEKANSSVLVSATLLASAWTCLLYTSVFLLETRLLSIQIPVLWLRMPVSLRTMSLSLRLMMERLRILAASWVRMERYMCRTFPNGRFLPSQLRTNPEKSQSRLTLIRMMNGQKLRVTKLSRIISGSQCNRYKLLESVYIMIFFCRGGK